MAAAAALSAVSVDKADPLAANHRGVPLIELAQAVGAKPVQAYREMNSEG